MSAVRQECIVPGCNRTAVTRGLCHSCYMVARRLVKNGVTSWITLKSAGLATGRQYRAFGTGPFVIAFAKLQDASAEPSNEETAEPENTDAS